jgi:hypothetical protein
MRKCTYCLTLGIGVCLCGVASAELTEFERPSAPACEARVVRGDFGPPPGCEGDTSPHNRLGWLTNVAVSTGSSVAAVSFINSPLVAATYRDLEDAAAEYDRGFDVTFWPNTPVKPTDGGSSGV